MSHLSLIVHLGLLIGLIALSAFFSASETAMMSLNRYRLRHLAEARHPGAVRARALLDRPDRLIGLILIGNNFVNISASAIATVIALHLMGEAGIALATVLLTLVVLIFAEVAPKTLAVLHPERVAFPAAFVLSPLLKLAYPLVWAVNILANGLLRLVGVTAHDRSAHHLGPEELRAVVREAGSLVSRSHRQMLLGILDLEKAEVEDIMVPRSDIAGVDLEDDWDTISEQLANTQHTRLPIYRGSIDNVVGMLHVRRTLHLLARGELTRDSLLAAATEVYFVPEGTPLHTQLRNFQREHRRIGLVVDEYGDIQGLVTLEDILEEVVGEFTTDALATSKGIHPQPDGDYLVDAGVSVRQLNRVLGWDLPVDGPRTLNGLILEYLESIPEPGTGLMLGGRPLEVLQTAANAVKTVRIGKPQDVAKAGASA